MTYKKKGASKILKDIIEQKPEEKVKEKPKKIKREYIKPISKVEEAKALFNSWESNYIVAEYFFKRVRI